MHINSLKIIDDFNQQTLKKSISGVASSTDETDKIVLVYDRVTADLIGSTMVDRINDEWNVFLPFRPDESLTILCRDEGGTFNADVYDRVSLCSESFFHTSEYDSLLIKNEKFFNIKESAFRISETCTIPSTEINQTVDLDLNKYITTIFESDGYFGFLLGGSFESIDTIINGDEFTFSSIALTNDNQTYSIYNSGWRDIASMDDSIHGNTGDSDWYFRDDANLWTKYSTGANIAISKAFEYANNLMTPDDLLLLGATEFNLLYDNTTGIFNPAVSIKNTNSGSSPFIERIIVNDKNFWESDIYDLTPYNGFGSSIISWSYESTNSNFKVYSIKTGDTAWAECTNGDGVPGLTNGTSTIGMEIVFKVEFDYVNDFEDEILINFELTHPII